MAIRTIEQYQESPKSCSSKSMQVLELPIILCPNGIGSGREFWHLVDLYLMNLFRLDLHDNLLTVGYPTTIGHEILVDLFETMSVNGNSYPRASYNGSTILAGGTADVHFANGIKAPDYSLYENREDLGRAIDQDDNTLPTILWEVAYSQGERKLALDAGRVICLTQGGVQLVVVINITHKKDSSPKSLQSVTWAHWEMDYNAWEELEDTWKGPIDNVVPDRGNEVVDEDFVHPIPTAYSAVIRTDDGLVRVRAVQTEFFCVRA